METWQFSLFFVALLVGYVIVHLRVARFEEHLKAQLEAQQKALSNLRSIDQGLGGLKDSLPVVDRKRFDRFETLLQRLHEDLEDLKETTASVGEAVVQVPPPPAAVAVPSPPDGPLSPMAGGASAGERIRSVVESRLLGLGYTRLNLLTDLSEASLENDVEVQVECERGRMPVKGRVVVRNGSVRDVAMQSVATTFP